MMRTLVTGADGQLGRDVCKALEAQCADYLGLSSHMLDVTQYSKVLQLFRDYKPDTVIHCAAYTQVDRAETERNRCLRVNVAGARIVAESCRAVGARMLYPSTDYVFSGTGYRPWETEDIPAPCNWYGSSKLAGEQAIREALDAHFIVRVSWLFGAGGNNFVKTMLRLSKMQPELRIVSDQIGSPTYTGDLAQLLVEMIQTEEYGVYHATNEGECSWAAFAREIFHQTGRDTVVLDILSKDYPTAAVRPLNSRLSKRSLDTGGFRRLPDWNSGLARFLKELKNV